MKKQIATIAFSLIALFTVSTTFARDAKTVKSGDATITVEGNKKSVFNQKGKLVYSVQRITSDNLPKNIVDVVREAYGQYYISGMEKVEQRGVAPVYFVHMEDHTTIKTVQVNGWTNETQMVTDLTKG